MKYQRNADGTVLTDRVFSDEEFKENKKSLQSRIDNIKKTCPKTQLTTKKQKKVYEQALKEFPVGAIVFLGANKWSYYAGVVQEIEQTGIIYVASVELKVIDRKITTETIPYYKDHASDPDTTTETNLELICSTKEIKILSTENRKSSLWMDDPAEPINKLYHEVKFPFKDIEKGIPFLPSIETRHYYQMPSWKSFSKIETIWSHYITGDSSSGTLYRLKTDEKGIIKAFF